MMSLMCSTCLWPKQLSSYDTTSTCTTDSILENISILVPRQVQKSLGMKISILLHCGLDSFY